MAQDSLVRAFSFAGSRFADRLRALLPVVLTGNEIQSKRAENILRKEANKAAETMKAAGRAWVKTEIPKIVIGGQKIAAREIGIKFGSPNLRLIKKFSLETNYKIAKMAETTRPFLAKALRKTTAVRIERTFGHRGIYGSLNSKTAQSYIESSLKGEGVLKATDRLIKKLRIEKTVTLSNGTQIGDRVLFASGRSMRADAYAKLLVRTQRSEAVSAAKVQEYKDNGFLFIETSSHNGVDEKDICIFLQGKVWALDENNLGIPVLPPEYGFPPWHPNCAHTFAAWIPELNGGDKAVERVAASHEDDAESLADWGGKTSQPKGEEN